MGPVVQRLEFIRLHRVELKKLDPDLYKARSSGRPGTVSYLNDILVESSVEPEGGWKPFLPRITSGCDQAPEEGQLEES